MLPFLSIALLVAFPGGVSLVPGGSLTFYVYDDDLNTNHRGIDEISTAGLLEFIINGAEISGPSKIIETSVDSGVFVGKINIPTSVSGKHLKQGDTLIIKYNDESDASGNPKIVSRSISIAKANTDFDTSSSKIRIGQIFQIKIYDPDFNFDSREVDNIPLRLIEFRASNGIRTTLADDVFNAKPKSLRETGDNTNLFVVTVKMPKEIDGKRLKIGSTAELRFTDTTSSSGTSEILMKTVRIGLG
jgi:hypothetical protein